jgi:hypothetical protein
MLDPDLAYTVDVCGDLGGDPSQYVVGAPNEDGHAVSHTVDFDAAFTGKTRIA